MRLPLSLLSLTCALGWGAFGCGALASASTPYASPESHAGSDAPAADGPAADASADSTEGEASDTEHASDATEKTDGDGDEGDVEEDEAANANEEHGSEHADGEEGAYAETDGTDLAVKASQSKPVASRVSKARPIDDLSHAELAKLLKNSPESLGPLSVGLPNSGRLFNAVELPESKYFHRVSPDHAFGTEETVDYLTRAVEKVHERYPDSPPLFVGHLSRRSGGYLSPHLSHQAGRDVDLGFYYSDKPRWYTRATAENLDVARTWALVRAVIVETDVEMVLVDHSIIALLKSYALSHGEDSTWVERVFSGKEGGRAIIRHARGHATHLHIRFFNPDAQRRGQKLYPVLVEQQMVPPVVVYSTFRAKKGDTLGKIAKRYKTSVEALKRANGLRKSLIVAGRVYKIAQQGGPKPTMQKLVFPPRELPPPPPAPTAKQRATNVPAASSAKTSAAKAPNAKR